MVHFTNGTFIEAIWSLKNDVQFFRQIGISPWCVPLVFCYAPPRNAVGFQTKTGPSRQGTQIQRLPATWTPQIRKSDFERHSCLRKKIQYNFSPFSFDVFFFLLFFSLPYLFLVFLLFSSFLLFLYSSFSFFFHFFTLFHHTKLRTSLQNSFSQKKEIHTYIFVHLQICARVNV